ncbi:MAG: hypothetical protein B7Z73_09165 [Planctomycetia bacterium 21-64-5]|nr:MAG: hypothetical protein B7Z73_09165 [Planctomycetia bacterium 21-64-5]HQU45532.1 hypothetical protein [Pirellulales bacterium]
MTACEPAAAPLMALEKWLGDRVDAGQTIDKEINTILKGSRSVAIAGMLADVGRRHPKLFDGALRALLKSSTFLLWSESLVRDQQPGWRWGPDTSRDEAFFEQHKAWLFAKYRKVSLLSIAENLLQPTEIQWDHSGTSSGRSGCGAAVPHGFDELRRLATSRLPAWTAHAADQLEAILGRPAAGLSQPEVPTPLSELVADIRIWNRLLILGARLTDDYLVQFEEPLATLNATVLDDDSDLRRLDQFARLGCATFFIARHADWLRGKSLWTNVLEYTIQLSCDVDFQFSRLPPAVHAIDWRPYLVGLAVQLWSECPDDNKYLAWVAHLAVFGNGDAQRELITATIAAKPRLGERVARLVHLLLKSAGAIWAYEFGEMSGHDVFDVLSWWRRQLKEYLAGQVSAEIPSLASLYVYDPPLWYADWRSDCRFDRDADIYYRPPAVEINVLMAVADALPPISASVTAAERQERMALILLGVSAALTFLRAYDESGRLLELGCDEYPTMMNQSFFLDRVAKEVVESQEAEFVEPLWQPIIALGNLAPHWVEYFVSKWLWQSLAAEKVPSNLTDHLKSMINFARDHATWQIARDDRFASGQCLWARLIGVDESAWKFWRKEHTGVVDGIAGHIEGVIKELVQCPATAGPVLRWISSGVGFRFSVSAVDWLADSIDHFRFDRDEQLPDTLAEFLDRTWSGARAALHDRGSMKLFHRLVRRVAGTGNFLALDLEQRVSGRL